MLSSSMETTNFGKEELLTERSINVTEVPTPTSKYRRYRKTLAATAEPAALRPIPIPIPPGRPGARVLIYKQDPSVDEVGIRKAFVPGLFFAGPRDARIISGPGIPPVSPNLLGDFIQTPNSDSF